MIYEEIPEFSDSELTDFLESRDSAKVCRAIISVALYGADERKATEICLAHLSSDDEWIARCSLTGLGHIARIHRNINFDIKRLECEIHENELDRALPGEVEDLRRDIRVYILKHHGLQ